jgi:hypothetical protein
MPKFLALSCCGWMRGHLGDMNLVIADLLLGVGRSESTEKGQAGNPVTCSYIIKNCCTRFPRMKSDDLKMKDCITEILRHILAQLKAHVYNSCYNNLHI